MSTLEFIGLGKDPNIALTSARTLGIPFPGTTSAQDLSSACAARGGHVWGHSAMVRAREMPAGFEVRPRAADQAP